MEEIVPQSFIDILTEDFFKEAYFSKTDKTPNDWRTISRPIQPRELQSHFKGSYYVGFIFKHLKTKHLIFDLDCHEQRRKNDLKLRFNKIVKIFSFPSLIATSPREGLHLYYFLEESIYPAELHRIIKQIIQLSSGYIELFPHSKALRLFGGRGTRFLNNDLKTICSNPSEFVEHFTQVYEHASRISRNDLERILSQKNPPKLSRTKELYYKNILDTGLTSYGTRNNIILELSRYFHGYKGYSKKDTANTVFDWFKKNHNGYSNDWNKNPEAVRKHIYRMVEYTDPSKIRNNHKYEFDRSVLNDSNISNINQLAIEVANENSFDLDKIEDFLLDFFSYCKTSHNNYVAEIPSTVFKKCRYGSGERYVAFKKKLEEKKVLFLHENYSTTSHKCNKYKILKKFINDKE